MKNETMQAPAPKPDKPPVRRDRPQGRPGAVRGWIVTALFVLAVFYTLFLTRELTLPIVLALLLTLVFVPIVRGLSRLHVPAPLGAALVVLGLTASIGYGAYLLTEPAAQWLQKSPQIVRDLEKKLRPLQQTVKEVDKAAAQVGRITGGDPRQQVEVKGPNLRQLVLGRTGQLLTGAVIMFFLLYFLLATRDRLIVKLTQALPTRHSAENLREIVDTLQRKVSRYLLTVTVINAGLGVVTAAVMYLFGMPNPLLWGALAALLNYVPYIGPSIMTAIITVVAILTFDQIGSALMVPAAFLILTALEGQLITPTILGRQLSLNPVVVFLGLIFWGWLWGVAGALVAVPLLVSFKIICDHVEPLHTAGRLLGR